MDSAGGAEAPKAPPPKSATVHVDSGISLAVSTRMPYCPILTFEDDSTYKHAKDKSDCNSFLLAVLSKYNG